MHVAFQLQSYETRPSPRCPVCRKEVLPWICLVQRDQPKKWSLGFLKSILVELLGHSFANRISISLLSIFVDQTRGKSMLIKNDASNMNNQIGRLIFLVWTALKPGAVKKTCTWSRLLAIYITVPILHWFSPKTETRITFWNGTLLSIGAPCVKPPLIFVRYALASAAQILSYLENGNGT